MKSTRRSLDIETEKRLLELNSLDEFEELFQRIHPDPHERKKLSPISYRIYEEYIDFKYR